MSEIQAKRSIENENEKPNQAIEEVFTVPAFLNDPFGMHVSNKGEELNYDEDSMLGQIGKHEKIITEKLSQANLDKLSPETKKNLSLLGRFKSIFAEKIVEQTPAEKEAYIKDDFEKYQTYLDLKKVDEGFAKDFLEISFTGIPKILKNESGKITGVIDATKHI